MSRLDMNTYMSDEYKDRYNIIALLKNPPWYYRQCNFFIEINMSQIH